MQTYVLFGGQRKDVGNEDSSEHTSDRKDAVQEGEGRLEGEVDIVVFLKHGYFGGCDEGEGVAGVDGRETDDEGVEEGTSIAGERDFVVYGDLLDLVFLFDHLNHAIRNKFYPALTSIKSVSQYERINCILIIVQAPRASSISTV